MGHNELLLIATVVGAVAAVALLGFGIWTRVRPPQQKPTTPPRSARRQIRDAGPKLIAKGREPFLARSADIADNVALLIGTGLEELYLSETDPGMSRLLRLADTRQYGVNRCVVLHTDDLSLSDDFWRALPEFANRLAGLERDFINSKFFPKVVTIAVNSKPLGLSLRKEKKHLRALVRAVPYAFHRAVLTARAADGLPSVMSFLEGNFRMNLAPGDVGRYVWLKVLQSVCKGATIDLAAPRLLDRLATPIERAQQSVSGSNVETDLLPQAEALSQVIEVGHFVLIALQALDLDIHG